MKRKIIFSFALLAFYLRLFSVFSNAEEPVFKSFDIRSENSRPRIIKLFLDRTGSIWCGTDKGVFVFDGINFTKIIGSDSISSAVSALFEDNTSLIWVGFENGKIIRIKNQKAEIYSPQEGVPKSGITAFAQDDENKIFFSTRGEGVYCLENGRMYNINTDDGLSDNYCYSMVRLPGNRICAGTDAGINFISFERGKKTVKVIGTSEGLPDDIARTLVTDKNNLWIGMQDKGIIRYDIVSNKLSPLLLKNDWVYGQVNCILPVDDMLWICTEEKGIVIIDRGGYITQLSRDGDNDIKASDLLKDNENNVWISESIHLQRTSGNKISFYKTIDEKKLAFIHCIIADKNGELWFSPDQQLGHVYKDKSGKYKYEEYKVTEEKVDIVTLHFDDYGYLWIGTLGQGAFRFNTKTGKLRKITEITGPESSSILSISGKGNHVWIGGFNSASLYNILADGNSDDAVIKKNNDFEQRHLFNDYIYSVFTDSRGYTWFGTDENGAYCFDGMSTRNFAVPDNSVHSFTEDKKNRIWFSTADAGLQFVNKDFTVNKFQSKDGLSDPSPSSILCTENGNIVIVNENGFDVLNPNTGNIIYHSSEENLSDINCDLNSITLSPDSTVWIGTEKGIIHYRPSSDMKKEKPVVVLQSISVFLNAIDFKTKNTFNAEENNFRFDFNGLWYSDPQRVNFQFKLDGYSNKWETTKDHSITFPKLPPAKYTFRIKASLNNDFTKAAETVYSFEILPPFWQRWWFRILSAGVIAFIILFIVRRREDRLRKFDRLQKEKIEFQFETLKSQVNPHFLFNSFNTLISVIENTPQQAVEYVERLSEFFRNLVNYRDKNLIRVSEELNLLDNYIFIQKKRFGNSLRLEIDLSKEVRAMSIPPLTLQLLAENAIKHNAVSKETPLLITITSQDERIVITNNINIKIKRETSSGFGLHNISTMYELLTDEEIKIEKTNERFTVTLPLIQEKHEYSDN